MADFRTPDATRNLPGPVELNYSFQLIAEFSERHVSRTSRGGRVFRQLRGGRIEGPLLQGTAYAGSGGDYGLIREDGVEDVHERFMLRAANGEWLYVSHVGYRRPDGYHRLQASFDADAGGPYAWLNDAVMLVTVDEADARTTYSYYQAI